MDIQTLKREIDAGKRSYEQQRVKEHELSRDLSSKKSQVSKYELDAKRAQDTADKYAEDLKRAQNEYQKLEVELQKVQSEMGTYKKDIENLDRQFRDMTERLSREARIHANDNNNNQRRAA